MDALCALLDCALVFSLVTSYSGVKYDIGIESIIPLCRYIAKSWGIHPIIWVTSMTFLCKPSLTCTESGFVLLALVSVKVLLSIRNLIARIRCLFTFHQPGAGLTIRTCKRICKL